METAQKEKTINELLNQRATLVRNMCTWWCTTQPIITSQIEKIDALIKQLNGINNEQK